MTTSRLQTYFFLSLFLTVLILVFFIFRPYLIAVALAGTFAVLLYPIYRRVLKILRGRATAAALLTTVLFLIALGIPLTLFGLQVFHEARDVYTYADNTGFEGFTRAFAYVEEKIHLFFPDFTFNADQYLKTGLTTLGQSLGGIFSSIASTVFSFFIGLIALYYFLKDGERFKYALFGLSPLADQYDAQISGRLTVAVNSVVKGSLIVAIVQGILTGIGFTLFGVPNPALWGGLTVLAALVPGIGTGLVLIPAILYLFVSGSQLAALGLLIWGITAVSMVDNFLGPHLIERGIRIHPFFILLSVLGGISLFGAFGFLLGPLVLSLFFALLDIYPLLVKDGTHT